MRRRRLAALLFSALLACNAESELWGPHSPEPEPDPDRSVGGDAEPLPEMRRAERTIDPFGSRASLVFEGRLPRIGDVLNVEIEIATPPDHRVHPIQWPAIEDVRLLEQTPAAVSRSGARWLHTTRLRLLPRKPGHFDWSGFSVSAESEAGDRSEVEVEGGSFEIVSVMDEFPERIEPFGVQPLVDESIAKPASSLDLRGVIAGGLAALALVVLLFSALRKRAGHSSSADSIVEPPTPAAWAQREFAAAESLLASDPRAAASVIANALRIYLDRRYGTDVRGATTAELSVREPVWYLRSRWRALIVTLRELDAERFPRPGPGSPGGDARIRVALEAAGRFVGETARETPGDHDASRETVQ